MPTRPTPTSPARGFGDIDTTDATRPERSDATRSEGNADPASEPASEGSAGPASTPASEGNAGPASEPAPGSEAPLSDGSWLAKPQPRLGMTGFLVLLMLANASCPMALDMYTPSVPEMPAYFSTSEAMINLTLLGFYLFFAIGMLVFGPVSDRYGRKPVLVVGTGAFAIGSALCAATPTVEALVLFRTVQALGAGSICAVSTAMVKDCFKPERRTQLLSVLQILMVIGPVAAPLIGGVIAQYSTWRTVFVVLAAVGAVCLALSLLFAETLPESERVVGGAAVCVSHLLSIAKNKRFMLFLLVLSLFSVPFMAYVAVASYVYVDTFATTQQGYACFFAATAAVSVCGPLVYLGLASKVTPRRFTYALIVVSLVDGAALVLVGAKSVWLFFGSLAIFALAEAAIRPYATDILLSQQDKDAGSASSLINFLANFFGVAGMAVIPLWSDDYVGGLAVLMAVSMAIALLLWAYLLHMKGERIAQFELPEK